MTTRLTSRRAFSVIEVVLAGAIGAIIVATAVGLLLSIEKTDRRLDLRHQQEVQLARTRTMLQRAMTSLVMEDKSQAAFQPDERTGKPAQPPPPARFSLHPSESQGAVRLFRMARLKGVDMGDAQKLEVVVDRPPRPLGSDLEHKLGLMDGTRSQDAFGALLVASVNRSAHRGTFELWPDATLPATREAEAAWFTTTGMTLWWIPSDEPGEFGVVPGAVPLVSGLISCQWRVFHDKEQKHDFESTWVVELPSYVEFECRTSSGIHANWMFEVMWTEGPEFAAPDAGAVGGEGTDGRGDLTGDEPADASATGGAPAVDQPRGTTGGSRGGSRGGGRDQ
jgi:hypothetical protein